MEEFLSTMIGRRLDIYCMGAATLRGELTKLAGGILHVKDEEGHTAYIAADKVVVVWETRDDEPRAGFVPTKAGTSRVGFKKNAAK
ncbi:MAG TPA: MM0924 family protein [Pyrinomonadaceae bacterium]|nr:MM0924 family protein [Pyrinomonadaceae bacterium]